MTWMIFHSQTQAMACRCVLVRKGVQCRLTKPARKHKNASCSWAVGCCMPQAQVHNLLCNTNIKPATWQEGDTP